jgi:NDP-sugar pyrophosphorylase family protein
MGILITNNHSYKENSKLNNLNINSKKEIIFSKKNKLINSGCYYISKRLLNNKNEKKSSIENDLIPELIKKKKNQRNYRK